MAIVEINIIPLGTKTPSVSKYVGRALKALRQEKNIKYELTSMGTTLEGDLDELLRIVKKMHESTFGDDIKRVVTTVRIDDRRDQPSSTSSKTGSALRELGY